MCKKQEYLNRGAKFKCEQHNQLDFDVKENIIIGKCGCKFSIDYLFLHQGKTLLHSR